MAQGNRRQISYVREGAFGDPLRLPTMKVIKNMSPTGIVLDRDAIDSDDWRADRSVIEVRSGYNKNSLSLPGNLAFQAYDDLMEAALFSRWLPETGAQPVSPGVSVTVAPATYTRAAGSWITDGFAVGQTINIAGFLNGPNNGPATIIALSALVMTVSAQAAVAEVLAAGGTFTYGNPQSGLVPVVVASVTVVQATYTRVSGSFLTDGFAVGDFAIISGFVNAGNNVPVLITALTATAITVLQATQVTEVLATGSKFDRWNGLPVQLGAVTLAVAAAVAGITVYTRSAGSFITDGLTVGSYCTIAGCTAPADNGTFKVTAVTALTVSLANASGVLEAAAASRSYISSTMILKDGVLPISFGFEEAQLDLNPVAYKTIFGAMVNQFQIGVKLNAPITVQFDLIAAIFGAFGPTQMASGYVQPPTTLSFDSFTGSVLEGGSPVATMVGLDHTLTNGLVAKYFGFQRNAAQIDADDTKITGTFSVYYKDTSMLAKFTGETNSSLTYTLIDLAGNSYTVTFPKVRYTAAKPKASKADISHDFAFAALKDATTACHVQITKRLA